MKPTLFIIAFSIILISCKNGTPENSKDQKTDMHKNEYVAAFDSILDSAGVEGSILFYDPQADRFYSNDMEWAKVGRLPASTFKIANSIIALESGVVEDDSTLFAWDGKPRRLKIWEQDLIFRQAFHYSCVPCYQHIARSIGPKRMQEYLSKLNYGNMQADSSNIDVFWLQGDSKISQLQQIDFLRRFYFSQLPISKRTEELMKELMVISEEDGYRLSGKTGWAIRNGMNNGWFVGYVEKDEEVIFFATNINPGEEFNMDLFPRIRRDITLKALEVIYEI